MPSPTFFEPASPVPVSAKVGCLHRNDNHVEGGRLDRAIAAGAEVLLARCVRLNGDYGLVHPNAAQRTKATVIARAAATRAMSSGVVCLPRKGLKPIEPTWYAGRPRWLQPSPQGE